MPRKPVFLCLAFLGFAVWAKPIEWWEEKPSAQWSLAQTMDFLENSPWVGKSDGYFRQNPLAIINYQARLITAKPVREAFLRLNVLAAKVVSIREINVATAAEESQKRMQNLVASYPNDLLIKGDEEHLIIAVSFRILSLGIFGVKSSREDFADDELLNVDKSKLVRNTSLGTNTGKRVALETYRPPERKLAGATYYFPRNLPDGSSLISSGDKDLRFETVINKRQVRVKFDLSKMTYNGKLEI